MVQRIADCSATREKLRPVLERTFGICQGGNRSTMQQHPVPKRLWSIIFNQFYQNSRNFTTDLSMTFAQKHAKVRLAVCDLRRSILPCVWANLVGFELTLSIVMRQRSRTRSQCRIGPKRHLPWPPQCHFPNCFNQHHESCVSGTMLTLAFADFVERLQFPSDQLFTGAAQKYENAQTVPLQ